MKRQAVYRECLCQIKVHKARWLSADAMPPINPESKYASHHCEALSWKIGEAENYTCRRPIYYTKILEKQKIGISCNPEDWIREYERI